MPDIHITKTHNFDFATARGQAQKWLDEAKSEFGLDIAYVQGDSFDTATISKAGVNAKAVLDAEKVQFEAELSFLAKALKTPISNGIQEGLNKYFS